MTELWYYAEGKETRGPISIAELVPALARTADPRRVMIWRDGFDHWKPVEDVHEVAAQLSRPPPLSHALPPVPAAPAVREPTVDATDASHFRDVKPELSGIGGWLGLLALGQMLGILRLVVSLGQYYATIDDEIWNKFPAMVWGEVALNVGMIALCVYSTVLLFRHSRHFPRVFIWQMIAVICLPLLDLFWVASMIALTMNEPVSKYLTLEAKEGAQMMAGVIGAAIWRSYILKSRRVRNTFTV